ncbi:helix-turn-helix transcriptional regulator [Euzebya sp.]|uniref:helix-turn-helix transcriptional regulator n=1 Tax=Euzebya sp. TaxID=1971409 RepID=UPI0035126F28
MNRTDRLYAIVEELRAVSPRPRSAPWLARRFEVSTRTIERDLLALQEGGVPLYAEPGRTGGYVLDASRSLPPVNFTPAEAVAIAAALQGDPATPLPASARSALTKVLGALGPQDAAAARELGARLVRFHTPERVGGAPRVLEQAIIERRVVRLRYRDKAAVVTDRVVEPLAVVAVEEHWYLTGWCRLRDGVRAFRLDRIEGAVLTREVAPRRDVPAPAPPDLVAEPALA